MVSVGTLWIYADPNLTVENTFSIQKSLICDVFSDVRIPIGKRIPNSYPEPSNQ